MIFVLFDYIQYRRRAGRYQRDVNKSGSLMGRGFDGKIPDELVSRLEPGDIICVQNFDWWVSWSIMYLTHWSISHVVFYLGNATIGHMTLEGAVKEPIETLWKSEARFLPFIWFMTDEQRAKIEPTMDAISDSVYYDVRVLVRKALRILSGRAWGAFRWTLFLDILFVAAVLDLLLTRFLAIPFFTLLLILYLALLIINRMRFWKEPLSAESPEDLIMGLFRSGRGIPLLDIHYERIKRSHPARQLL